VCAHVAAAQRARACAERARPLGWQFRSILGFVSADEQPGFKEPMHTDEEPVHIHEEPMAEQPVPAMPDQDERSAQWQQPGEVQGDVYLEQEE